MVGRTQIIGWLLLLLICSDVTLGTVVRVNSLSKLGKLRVKDDDDKNKNPKAIVPNTQIVPSKSQNTPNTPVVTPVYTNEEKAAARVAIKKAFEAWVDPAKFGLNCLEPTSLLKAFKVLDIPVPTPAGFFLETTKAELAADMLSNLAVDAEVGIENENGALVETETKSIIATVASVIKAVDVAVKSAKAVYTFMYPESADEAEHRATASWLQTTTAHFKNVKIQLSRWEDIDSDLSVIKENVNWKQPEGSPTGPSPFQSALRQLKKAAKRYQTLLDSMAHAKKLSMDRSPGEEFWDHSATLTVGFILTAGLAPLISKTLLRRHDYEYKKGYLCVSEALKAVDKQMTDAEVLLLSTASKMQIDLLIAAALRQKKIDAEAAIQKNQQAPKQVVVAPPKKTVVSSGVKEENDFSQSPLVLSKSNMDLQ